MERELLTDIIAVEKEVRERLDAEREKAAARLAQVRREAEEELRREEEALKSALNQAVDDARQEAERKARLQVEQTAAWAKRIEELDEGTLRDIVMRHLARLRPGTDHDRQNGEG